MKVTDGGAILARAIDSVHVNRCWRDRRGWRDVWIKRRRPGADPIVLAGNVFLALSNSRIRMFPSARRWVRWELSSFQLVNGDRFASSVLDERAIWLETIPGQSLREICTSRLGNEGLPAVVAAAREFARAHALTCPLRRAPWSHGDPHLANVLYDAANDRARLIDFETAHEPRMVADERHADDLLTLSLELMAKSRGAAPAAEFLRSYQCARGDKAVIERVVRRLWLPTGLELVLWQTRTDHASRESIETWLRELRGLL